MRRTNRFESGRTRSQFKPDETNNDLRQPYDASVFPYIPKARQQRSGLLIDFLSMRGTSEGTDHIDLLMLGENRFGTLLLNIPSGVGASDEDLLVLKSALRDQKAADSAAATLRALDQFFSEHLKSAAGVQAFYCILNQNNHTINFASAAHPPMMLFKPDAKKLYRLNCDGNALGLAPQAYKDFNGRMRNSLPNLKSESACIQQHDLVVLYSPGTIEAKNAWGEPFGLHRLLKVIRKNGHMQPTPFLVELQNAIEQFTLGETLQQDITVVALKNMLPDVDGEQEPTPTVAEKFLTIEEEEQLIKIAEKHPDARITELMNLLGERYASLGHERIRYYLANGSRFSLPNNGYTMPEKPRRRIESAEKHFQKQMLQAFPIRQLLYRKYEFRGNTGAIAAALKHYQSGNFQESLVEFIKVRKAIAESESVYCFFGNLYLLLNMSIKARQEYLKALKMNPRSVHAFLALGYISLLHEDYDGTINYMVTAIRLDANLSPYAQFLRQLVLSIDRQNEAHEWIV